MVLDGGRWVWPAGLGGRNRVMGSNGDWKVRVNASTTLAASRDVSQPKRSVGPAPWCPRSRRQLGTSQRRSGVGRCPHTSAFRLPFLRERTPVPVSSRHRVGLSEFRCGEPRNALNRSVSTGARPRLRLRDRSRGPTRRQQATIRRSRMVTPHCRPRNRSRRQPGRSDFRQALSR